MEFSNYARARMRAYSISESEVDHCLDHRSSSYFAGADVVYVYNDDQRGMLKVRVRGGAAPRIIDVFRVRRT